MDIRQAIAKNIRLLIKSSGKTQSQIGEEIGVAQTTVGNYMLGKAVPSLLVLIKLCQILDCTYEDILGQL